MRHTARLSLATMLVLGATSVGCSGISYNSDFDPGVDFSSYKTYVWMEVAAPSQALDRGVNELVEKRIIAAVDEALAAKGYTKRDSGPADFVVHFMVTAKDKIDFQTYYTGWGYYGWYGGTQVEARQYTEGTLFIDFFDPNSKAMAWRGMATGTIEPSYSPEQRNARITAAVNGILQRFPPGG